MQLKQDFHKNLKKYGQLPIYNPKQKFLMTEKLQYYKKIRENLFPEIEE